MRLLKISYFPRKIYFFLLFALLSHFIFSQPKKLSAKDSLLQELKKTQEDSSMAKTLYELGWLLHDEEGNTDSAVVFMRRCFSLAEKNELKPMRAKAARALGTFFAAAARTDSSTKYFLIAWDYYKTIKLTESSIRSLNLIGNNYFYESNYLKAQEYYLLFLTYAEKNNLMSEAGHVYSNLGNVYKDQNKPKEAQYYFKKGYEFGVKFNQVGTKYISLINMGSTFSEMGRAIGSKSLADSALGYYFTAEKLLLNTDDSASKLMLYDNIANVYADLGQREKAIGYYKKSLNQIIDKKKVNQLGLIYNNIAEVYLDMGDLQNAEAFLKLSLEASERAHSVDELKECYREMARFYKMKNDFANAYKYHVLYKQYSDSLFNDENTEKRKELEMNFEYGKKETLAKAEQDKKDAMAEAEARKQKIILWFTGIGLFVVIIFSVFIFRSFLEKKKANQTIALQKNLVEVKNKEITDSIHYAEKIQHAVLPHEQFSKILPESFMVFMPRDIVSGDFFWIAENENYIFYAAADCTGHGVPGGFMSMLATSLLNEVVVEKSVHEPKDVLETLRNKIVKALKQTGKSGENKDGMDLVFCRLEKSKKEICFSAANNPLWLCRKNTITEYSGDKMPVGISLRMETPFSQTKIELEKGDIIFTGTDGFPDQFGGPKGKKFKYKPLKEILLKNSALPLTEQKTLLEKTFSEWKKDLEQVDDVLLIGVRV